MKSKTFQIECGDSAELIRSIPNNSIHAVVTDPPYFINLMGQKWDKALPSLQIWQACFDILRPGGFLLSFGHSRMYHRLGVQLEDAGFVIRDCLIWCQSQGFPHSYNMSLGIDEHHGATREVVARRVHPTLKNRPKVKANMYHADSINSDEEMESWDITAPATEDAKKWDGWGTQLKPAFEPIILAQKPLEGTFVENVLKWKVGALNIDACRIPYASEEDRKSLESFVGLAAKDCGDPRYFSANTGGKKQVNVHPLGRWPANVVFLDPLYADYDKFFLIPKPSKSEKGENNEHTTVKPVRLMEHLVKLVTPKPSVVGESVTVLDPFCGSGTTGIACLSLGRHFIGFEKDEQSYLTTLSRLKKQKAVDIFEM